MQFTKVIKRNQKRLIVGLTILAMIAGVVIVSNYFNYKHGNRSHLFGTLDTYSQNQTLKFDDFDIWVSEVERWDFCGKNIADFDPKAYQVVINPNDLFSTNNPPVWPNGPRKNLAIHFFYKNTATKVVSLNPYYFKPVANTQIFEKDRHIRSGDMLPGSVTYANISFSMAKDYQGPLRLVVTKGSKKKSIELNIPTQIRCRW